MEGVPLVLQILFAAVLIALAVWRMRERFAYAAERSARSEERRALRALHTTLLGHPAWDHLWSELARRGLHVSPNGPLHLGLLTVATPRGPARHLGDPNVRWLVAYLRGPKKRIASITLSTGEIHVRDCGRDEWPDAAFH